MVETKHHNVMLDGLLNNLLENYIETHENIRKLAPNPGNDCMNGFLLSHLCFKTRNCKSRSRARCIYENNKVF